MTTKIAEYIGALLASERYGRQVVDHRILPARDPEYAELQRPLSRAVQALLDARGIRLYTHQAAAIDRLRAGRHVVVSSPTASGKSLIYTVPILEHFVHNSDTRALWLFPLKALAQDQFHSLHAFVEPWAEAARPSAALYDGDTSSHFRRKIRRNPPHVLISNPEMLHLSLLPQHAQWAAFWASLTHVVLDEAHTYRGVFGAHMAQLVRRLTRICAHYGSQPVWTLCTATVGNPGQLAGNLLDLPNREKMGEKTEEEAKLGLTGGLESIEFSGAPQGARHSVFLNPEDSPSSTAIQLLRAALSRGLRTIVYCRSRRMTELISLWASEKAGDYAQRIRAYRAGFLPEERRDIEARLSSGELLAVVSTSALELGIDIGSLDVCILVGYPGTIMSTLQRGGRVGRAQQESAVLLVAGEDALDQYFMHNPEDFFRRPPENALLNPENEQMLLQHVECAAAEMPIHSAEPYCRPATLRALYELNHKGLLLQSADGTQWLACRKRPHRHVDLRGAGQAFVIEDEHGHILGSIDGARAFHETHPGAVYLHQGVSYVVTVLDPPSRTVRVARQSVNWFTRTRSNKQTEILEVRDQRRVWGSTIYLARLRVTEQITAYEKRSTSGNRLLTIVPLDLPPLVFETEGIWLDIPDSVRLQAEAGLYHFMGGIHALEHVGIALLPLLALADRNDFGGISTPLHPQTGQAAVFVYDALSGGAGLSRMAFEQAENWLDTVLERICTCPRENGCPSCVHSPKCGSGNRPIDKHAARFVLEALRGLPPAEDFFQLSPPQGEYMIDAKAPEASSPVSSSGSTSANGLRSMVLDVETRLSAEEVGGWNKAHKMGVSIAVLYDSHTDSYHRFEQDALPALFELLRAADQVIGFNILRFDYAVLQPFASYDLHTLPTLDMLEKVRERLSYRLSLDNLASATLDAPKSADGLQALQWWKEGRLQEIADYCQKDVELTLRLYLHAREHGYLLFTNKAKQKVRLPLEW